MVGVMKFRDIGSTALRADVLVGVFEPPEKARTLVLLLDMGDKAHVQLQYRADDVMQEDRKRLEGVMVSQFSSLAILRGSGN